MKINFLFLQLLFIGSAAFSQVTQKEFEEMQKKLQKKVDSALNDPNLKKYINNPTTSFPGNQPASNQPSSQTFGKSDKDFEKIKLPPKDTAKIKTIPAKTFSLTELRSYLDNLYVQLSKKFPADAVSSANAIATKLGNNPSKLEATALAAWQNGANEEAMLLITKGAIASGDDGLVLTNAGGILTMCGLSEKAVPILRTVAHYDPQNAIALNNLGQAFTALGMQDSAMQYFGRCLNLSPQHPEANNTAGIIELAKGNKQKAQAYFENSIRGGFNLSAYSGLRSILKEKCRIATLIKPKVKLPEYFNQFKYKLTRQCTNVREAATVKKEFETFKQLLNNDMRKYDKLKKEAEKNMGSNWAENFNKKTLDKVMQGQSYVRPFQVLGGIIESESVLGYQNDIAGLAQFNKENREQYKQLEKEYQDAYEQMMRLGSYDCGKENELKNKYLERFAQLNKEWQSRNMLIENKYIDDLLYWCYFSGFDLNDYRLRFYNWVYNYLYKVNWLAQVKILEPCKETEPGEVEKPEEKELKEFDCPADIEFPFIFGKLTMSCEKFSFKAGEGIVFKYEKKLTGQKQSTITIGAGGGVDASWKLGGVKAGFEAGMNMSFYVTFDKAGNCTDGGMMYSASRGAGLDFSAGERIKFKKNMGYTGEEIGWRFGINSGVSFTTPDMPYMKDQQETPLNKNVKIYKPN